MAVASEIKLNIIKHFYLKGLRGKEIYEDMVDILHDDCHCQK